MIGNIQKIHSDFYYVKVDDLIVECKIREILKKERVEIYVGDKVKLEEYNAETNQGVITEVLERKNYIPRPAIANIDQVIIVTSLKEPHVDYIQLNRYLSQAKLYNIPVIICVNKEDLIEHNKEKMELLGIYEPLGYKVLFTCAINNEGISELEDVLANKVSVLCGSSGVGKSSILNSIIPDLNLKTKKVSLKTERGTHTTRHTELISINLGNHKKAQVADTPGFSHLRFDNIMPDEVALLFSEIHELSYGCQFNNCLHLSEVGCNVIACLNDISPSRYESYVAFVNEAVEYKEKLNQQGHKQEQKYKTIDKKNKKVKIVKLNSRARDKSRKSQKQELNEFNYISSLKDAYYNDEDNI